ncbi:ATP-binding protein [Streptomyces sp. NPDC001922]|uniref:ATP-binding protein n=1 Tax=Streptomyces sp. NPDC001922 TaxID=3364624 RepID=UPI003680B003
MKSETLHAVNHFTFTVMLSSTRRGARLARKLATRQLVEWGWSYDSDAVHDATLLVGELATNAATHGRTPGRDFRLRLALLTTGAGREDALVLRMEVTDTRPDRLPPASAEVGPPAPDAEGGRGLLLVDALVDRRGVELNAPLTKTVWCELALFGNATIRHHERLGHSG